MGSGGAEKEKKKWEVEGQEKRECQHPAAQSWGYEMGEGRKLGAQEEELMKAAGIWGPLKNKFVILHTAHVWKDRHFWRPREELE